MKHLNYSILTLFMLATTFVFSQEKDFEYEIKHKSQPWFSNMRDGANYFEVKRNFDTYFGSRKWEKSKPRALGESWLKSKLFYLDKNGIVQPEPKIQKTYLASTKNLLNKTSSTTTIGTWNLIGPVNSVSTGQSGEGDHGGYVFLNRIDPTNNLKRFVSFVTGGLWMTTDGGINWNLVDANMPDEKYYDIDVAISNPQIIYAISNQQVIKSTDGGYNWSSTSLTNLTYLGSAYDIAVSTSNPNIVVARWEDKIYRTVDGGTTWNVVQNGLGIHTIWDSSLPSEMLDWSSTNSDVVYSVSTNHNNTVIVHRSDNSGATFSQIATLTLDPSANGQVVGWARLMLPSDNANSIYIAVGSGPTARGHKAAHLYKLNATTGALENLKTNMISGIGEPFNYDPVIHHGDICMDRTNENIIVYGSYSGKKVFVSTDNGTTFNLAAGSTHSDIRTIDVVNGLFLVGSDGETVESNDMAQTMTTLTNSISNHELWGFGSAFKTNLVASGNNHGPAMIKESANGYDWYAAQGGDQGNTDVNPLDDRYIYSQGYNNYRFFRTGTHTFVNQDNFLDLGGFYHYFNSIEFHPNYYYTIITHHAGQFPENNPNLNTWKNSLIKTEDNGNSISIVKTFSSRVFREKISMKNPDHMYVVEGELTNHKLWHTSDGGDTWVDVTPSTVASSGQTNISDIAVGDENPNEIWVTYSGVQSVCKVLKSSDYGNSWTNLTQANLTDHPITKIIFQRGSDGGVYVGNKSGVYYKNNTMSNWVPLGNGLPMCEIRFMFINYNENKLKIGTSRGAFSHDLYEISPPNALISASTSLLTCPGAEKIQFKDYSVVRNASATWSWSFPGGTPATSTAENPEVSYANAPDGFYDVTLTVTDAYGTSTQELTNVIEIVNQCGTTTPDSIPGNIALLSGSANNDYLTVNDLNLSKNSFTFSCWIKPNGIQDNYSAIFCTQDNNSPDFALNFRDGDNTLGFHPTWQWSSGLKVPADQWSHVAMVSNGTDVRIYVNGEESINTTKLPAEVFSDLDIGRYGNGFSNRYTNLELDEVCIWNRPLSMDEIRSWRHLCKTDPSHAISSGLVAYYQFNETGGNISPNKTDHTNNATYNGTSINNHISSDAPVFHGESQKINVTSAGLKDFNTTGLSMVFDNGTYPNGDVWVSRSHIDPDVLPDALPKCNSYYVINNYGSNKTFTPLTSMSFTDIQCPGTTTNLYDLYKRESNDFGNKWGKVGSGSSLTGTGINANLTFSAGLNVSSFSQFMISSQSVLPVELLDFTAVYKPIQNQASLTWQTASEINNDYFTIERSKNGIDWQKLKAIKGSGNSSALLEYKAVDDDPFYGVSYYRLKQTDFDGQFSYSKIASIVNQGRADLIKIYPNPLTGGSLSVDVPSEWGSSTMIVYSALGEKLSQISLKIGINQLKMNIDPGVYYAVIVNQNQSFTRKIIME